MSQPGQGSTAVRPLSDMSVGQRGKVLRVEGTDDISLRLMEMGLTPGVPIHLLGTAPLGDPLELEVRGYRLSVRKSEAARVLIDATRVDGTESGR